MDHFIKHLLGAHISITAHQHGHGFILAAAAEQVAGGFTQTEGTEKQEKAGNGANPENGLPRKNLGGSQRFLARAGIFHAAHITGGKQTDYGGEHQAHRQQELEHPRPFATGFRAQTLSQVQGNHHAYNTSAGALENTAQQHDAEHFLGQADHGNTHREQGGGYGNQRLASQLVRQIPGKQGRKHAAEQHGRHHLGKLGGIETSRLLNVGERRSNHADVHTVEQAAQTGHDEEVAHVSPGRIRNGGLHVFLVCHGRCILVNWLFSATKKETLPGQKQLSSPQMRPNGKNITKETTRKPYRKGRSFKMTPKTPLAIFPASS